MATQKQDRTARLRCSRRSPSTSTLVVADVADVLDELDRMTLEDRLELLWAQPGALPR